MQTTLSRAHASAELYCNSCIHFQMLVLDEYSATSVFFLSKEYKRL